ncbi:MAG: DUF4190 domain-containing protein [Oscillospiraceae bacterium]|jgi:hypothetical protein|nr:DUF4190 domain-containing protein [Oscillospiraceae bacterium]
MDNNGYPNGNQGPQEPWNNPSAPPQGGAYPSPDPYQQQSPYPQNPYGGGGLPPVPPASNGKAIAALVMGIVGIVLFWVPFFNTVTLILSIVGVVLAVGARKEAPQNAAGIATAGLVLSVIGLVVSGIGFISCTLCAIIFTLA